MKIKKMPLKEFEEILKRDWVPLQLAGDKIPEWAQSIPEGVMGYAYASGTCNPDPQTIHKSKMISSGELIGGIDIYRLAPDDPVELNKDWYAVVRCPDDPTVLLVDGPIKDAEHWLNDIPERLKGAEILGVPKPKN
jgi:hypothetical protein